MKAYEDRIRKNENFLKRTVETAEILHVLFDVLGKNWSKCKPLQDLMQMLITEFENLDLMFEEEDSMF